MAMKFFLPNEESWHKLKYSVLDSEGKLEIKEHDTAEIKIRFIPHGLNEHLLRESRRIAMLASGIAKKVEEGIDLTDEEVNKLSDFEKMSEKLRYELVRFGVIDHKGFIINDVTGDEVPFKTVKEKFNGEEYDVVSPETMNFYRVNKLLTQMNNQVKDVQLLPEKTRLD